MKKDFRVLLFYPNQPMLGYAPSNLAILASFLKNDGFDVKLFDCSIYKQSKSQTNDDVRAKLGHVKPTRIDEYFKLNEADIHKDFLSTIDDYKPNLIGFSVLDSTISFSYSFARLVRDRGIPIVFGGIGATFSYDRILKSGLVDFVCVGEGEGALVDLANALLKKEDCSRIPNIYTMNASGAIVKNKLRPLVDLDSLPMPDFSIYENYRFYRPFFGNVIRTITVDMDRGCPYACTFCISPALKALFRNEKAGRYYRVKSTDKIFEEMHFLIKEFDIDYLMFNSETFTALPLELFKKFAIRYESEIALPFTCQSRLDSMTAEKTALLAKMGCKTIAVGLEHGSERIRNNLLNKRLSNNQIISAFKELAKYDIVPGINSMIGLPDETREDVFETIRLAKEISQILKGKHTMNVFTFIPFCGTQLRDHTLGKGYIRGDEDISISFFDKSILNMSSMSQDEIAGLEKTFVLYVMLPESYYPDIRIAERSDKDGEKMFRKLMGIKNEITRDTILH